MKLGISPSTEGLSLHDEILSMSKDKDLLSDALFLHLVVLCANGTKIKVYMHSQRAVLEALNEVCVG